MDCPITAVASRGTQITRSILVVEDEDVLRSAIAGALRAKGYRVIEANNVAEARQWLQPGSDVDLVFTDFNMPGDETGLDLAHWIGSAFPHMAVLLTSGQVGGDQIGGLPFLRKPYRVAQVVQAIQQLLGG